MEDFLNDHARELSRRLHRQDISDAEKEVITRQIETLSDRPDVGSWTWRDERDSLAAAFHHRLAALVVAFSVFILAGCTAQNDSVQRMALFCGFLVCAGMAVGVRLAFMRYAQCEKQLIDSATMNPSRYMALRSKQDFGWVVGMLVPALSSLPLAVWLLITLS